MSDPNTTDPYILPPVCMLRAQRYGNYYLQVIMG